jgi:hypothetical protein
MVHCKQNFFYLTVKYATISIYQGFQQYTDVMVTSLNKKTNESMDILSSTVRALL